MHSIAPSGKDVAAAALEKRLWDADDQSPRPTPRKAQGYAISILGLIFLRFAEVCCAVQRAKPEKAIASSRCGSRVDEPATYHIENLIGLPSTASDPKVLEKLPNPMLAMSERIRVQAKNLGRTCDLLLPCLISGQVNLGEN